MEIRFDIPEWIETESIKAALKMKEYFMGHAKATFGCTETNKQLEDLKYLFSVIERKSKDYYKEETIETVIFAYLDIQQYVKKRFGKSSLLKVIPNHLG